MSGWIARILGGKGRRATPPAPAPPPGPAPSLEQQLEDLKDLSVLTNDDLAYASMAAELAFTEALDERAPAGRWAQEYKP